jgi:hypothetical protein
LAQTSGIKPLFNIPDVLDVVGVKFKISPDDLLTLKSYIGTKNPYVSIKYSQSPEFKGRREVYIGGKHIGCLSQKSASADCFAKMKEGEEFTILNHQISGLDIHTTYSEVCSRYVSFQLINK